MADIREQLDSRHKDPTWQKEWREAKLAELEQRRMQEEETEMRNKRQKEERAARASVSWTADRWKKGCQPAVRDSPETVRARARQRSEAQLAQQRRREREESLIRRRQREWEEIDRKRERDERERDHQERERLNRERRRLEEVRENEERNRREAIEKDRVRRQQLKEERERFQRHQQEERTREDRERKKRNNEYLMSGTQRQPQMADRGQSKALELPMVTDIRYRDRPEQVTRFVGDREVTLDEYQQMERERKRKEEKHQGEEEERRRENRERRWMEEKREEEEKERRRQEEERRRRDERERKLMEERRREEAEKGRRREEQRRNEERERRLREDKQRAEMEKEHRRQEERQREERERKWIEERRRKEVEKDLRHREEVERERRRKEEERRKEERIFREEHREEYVEREGRDKYTVNPPREDSRKRELEVTEEPSRIAGVLERIEDRLHSLEKRMRVEEAPSQSGLPKPVSDKNRRKKRKATTRTCRYPECDHVFTSRNYNPKRHVRSAHLPWFASVHLEYPDLIPLTGFDDLWVELLVMLSRYVTGRNDLEKLFIYVLDEKLHPNPCPDPMAAEEQKLVRFLDAQKFKQNPDAFCCAPPNCIAAIASISVLMPILDKLDPMQRAEVANYKIGVQQRMKQQWPECTILRTDKAQAVSEFAVSTLSTEEITAVSEFAEGAVVSTTSTQRHVDMTADEKISVRVSHDVGRSSRVQSATASIMAPVVQMEMIDSHFHFDRMLANQREWTWDTPACDILDHGATTEAHLKYAATSFCDPEWYPSDAKLQSLKADRRVLLTFGVHPKKVNRMDKRRWDQLTQLLQRSDALGLGEVGLDYTSRTSTKREQEQTLRMLLQLPLRPNQIVVLHLRGTQGNPFEVYDDFLRIANKYLRKGTKLHFHSFTGPVEFLAQLHHSNFPRFLLGVNSLAVKGHLSSETQQAIYSRYQKHVVLESDAPHLSFDNQDNFPHSVYFVAAHLSGKWKISLQSVLEATNTTFLRMYEPWFL